MEINNWFDFIIYTIYFFGVVIVMEGANKF
ncbi:hypothetical protein PZV96_08540, partial [Klebsiella pneumoniae]|nr:hypothetical protein [Klebsiella pneumoniae]